MNAEARLLEAARDQAARDSGVAALLAGALDGPLEHRALKPSRLPVVDVLPDCLGLASPATERLTRAVIDAAPRVRWRHTYSPAQVGEAFLAGSGWFNLVSPDGPYVSQTCRVSIGYWAAGLDYPDHAHAPEEIYLVLAGSARFRSDGQVPRTLGPGESWHNPGGVMHGALMVPGPLLAIAYWSGPDLNAPSTLASDPTRAGVAS